MSQWLILAASAGGVAFMVAVAALMGFRQRARIDASAFAELAALEGATVQASVVDKSGLAGVARLGDGRWLAARVMADGVGARAFAADAVRVRQSGDALKFSFGDVGYPAMTLRLNEPAPAWLKEKCA